jgi:hypothetical protein
MLTKARYIGVSLSDGGLRHLQHAMQLRHAVARAQRWRLISPAPLAPNVLCCTASGVTPTHGPLDQDSEPYHLALAGTASAMAA